MQHNISRPSAAFRSHLLEQAARTHAHLQPYASGACPCSRLCSCPRSQASTCSPTTHTSSPARLTANPLPRRHPASCWPPTFTLAPVCEPPSLRSISGRRASDFNARALLPLQQPPTGKRAQHEARRRPHPSSLRIEALANGSSSLQKPGSLEVAHYARTRATAAG